MEGHQNNLSPKNYTALGPPPLLCYTIPGSANVIVLAYLFVGHGLFYKYINLSGRLMNFTGRLILQVDSFYR